MADELAPGQARMTRWERKMKRINEGLLIESEFYEPFDSYQPSDNIRSIVEELLPKTWRIYESSAWQQCNPPLSDLTIQGWKIHISATPLNLRKIVGTAVPVLVKHSTSFKFAADGFVFEKMNSKHWSRGGSGKFMTVYPRSEEAFKTLIEELYNVLKLFEGPYILSDKRYKNCKVLYYRYGGIASLTSLNANGEETSFIIAPDGTRYTDARTPYFSLPYWITDIFPDWEEDDSTPGLDSGRFIVEETLGHTNTGGVYKAQDQEAGHSVIVKEARPYTDMGIDGEDVTYRLKKEFRILSKLSQTGYTAKPVSLFVEWEHVFLAQEHLQGETLSSFLIQNDITLLTKCNVESVKTWLKTTKEVVIRLAKAIKVIHEHGIVIGDLSLGNILVDKDSLDVKFIDLEGALELGVDDDTGLFTPGFAPIDRTERQATFADDYFGLGALILSFSTPATTLSLLDKSAPAAFLTDLVESFNLDLDYKNIILELLDEDPEARPKLEEVIGRFGALEIVSHVDKLPIANHKATLTELQSFNTSVVDFILHSAQYDREDRLFPPDMQASNPLSLDHGALGVAYVLKQVLKEVPNDVMRWIEHKLDVSPLNVPGLYNGLAGIAWVLSDLDKQNLAGDLIEDAYLNPRLFQVADLGYGAAGVGYSLIKLWRKTGVRALLDKAEVIAAALDELKLENERGFFWPSLDDTTYLGYMRGASGISFFLLHLYLATGEQHYLETGKRALNFDLSYAVKIPEGYLSFPEETNFKYIVYPYLNNGTAGIATVLLRYYLVTKDDNYKRLLKNLYPDIARKYTVFPGLFNGVAGLGNFLLDYYQVMHEPAALSAAHAAYQGLRLFGINKDEGIALPGDHLLRLSTDLATGSAGVLLFTHRLSEGGENLNFCIDDALPKHVFEEKMIVA